MIFDKWVKTIQGRKNSLSQKLIQMDHRWLKCIAHNNKKYRNNPMFIKNIMCKENTMGFSITKKKNEKTIALCNIINNIR